MKDDPLGKLHYHYLCNYNTFCH